MHLAIVAGARPNFMKIAPILREIDGRNGDVSASLVHTGQHYDRNLSDIFFEQLEIRPPDISLGVGGGTHGQQTARILEAIEPVLAEGVKGKTFDRLVVVGDVNSTMAAAIAASKLEISISHVEAGLRSFDRSMPEEINRLVTDAIADQLLVSEPSGVENLLKEGHQQERIHLVGNLMIDTLRRVLPKARETTVLSDAGLSPDEYGVVTLHRPSNVDDAATLESILRVLSGVSQQLPLVFPIHPRTSRRIEEFDLAGVLDSADGIVQMPPVGYLEFLALTSSSKVIVTDSGGLQEESTALGVPCLTMRENTERPSTVTVGSSTLVGNDAAELDRQLKLVLAGEYEVGRCPELWDGNAASRVLDVLLS